MPHAERPRRVVVALSGGVDSSVVAWLLQQAGHDVIGVSLRLAPDDTGSLAVRHGRCCSHDDLTDARRVADAVGAPFYALDARARFKDAVFDPFVSDWQSGRTPIPCLACNHDVKLGDLLKTARAMDAVLATGHYVRRVARPDPTAAGVVHAALARPADRRRDQSYWLYGTPFADVADLLFPLGDLDKPLVRALAARAGLPVVSHKPDSQEICFVPDGDHAAVVERAAGPLPAGELVHIGGRRLGTHKGVHHFTVGQRRGTGVASPNEGERLYVVDVDAASHTVTLGPREALATRAVRASPLRCAQPLSSWPRRVFAQVRARHAAQSATWAIDGDALTVRFDEPVHGVAPGQALVVYDDDVVLGGAVIDARDDGAIPRATRRPSAPASSPSSGPSSSGSSV
ncbi:MAG: tRNA 2-thiouridine(34) synthase MnmA [Deltaproteobacteria bacterium]|nr:tRNA 2-thiouridine(34) synthase MnmA [Deltaproteobacteria bacterium]